MDEEKALTKGDWNEGIKNTHHNNNNVGRRLTMGMSHRPDVTSRQLFIMDVSRTGQWKLRPVTNETTGALFLTVLAARGWTKGANIRTNYCHFPPAANENGFYFYLADWLIGNLDHFANSGSTRDNGTQQSVSGQMLSSRCLGITMLGIKSRF